ncbi:site-specific DNA-methyltransferase [Aeromonas hydrophila]|uniref:site-specific DNA-methyltransferase n=2 Tax=Aeromonadaceae TaxID=84642 RepID=UPI001FF6808B|nr:MULTISPECIES: site-specific DNA-methyltransferase [Aeromonas]MCK0187660.1 site-specific DNA-methyltransferase [Aeromonas hydrophila]UOV94510.1 site-specific DNA-methyltransferase [Aeromonas hydrophila]
MKKLSIDSPALASTSLIEENMGQLKRLFPDAFSEGKIDFDVLKQLLGSEVDDSEERYGLNWHGKRQARQIALTPSRGTLRPCPEDSVDWDSTQNLMIEGDNLEILKLLQKSYSGKVKLIYIDPPYNTGKDFVYRDDFHDNIQNYLELSGQIDGGQHISSNTETSGRFHTDWLNMIYPRLKLTRNLLRHDGVVFISIDDRELNNLRALANEIFGEENFVATVSVVNNMKGRNDKKHIAACHEYVVIYAAPSFLSNGLPLTEEQRAAFKYADDKGFKYTLRDLRKRGGPDRREDRPNMYFPIFWNEISGRCYLERQTESDIEILPLKGDGSDGCWRWGIDKVRKHLDWMHPKRSDRTGRLDVEHRVYLDTSISIDGDIEEEDEDEDSVERTSKPKSVWFGGEFSSDSGKRALKELMPGDTFDFPKSIDFMRTCILLGSSESDVVLDLFSGSGSMAQAIMLQNAMDGQSRRFVCVQLPEPLDPLEKKQKAGAVFCDKLGKPRNIAELTKERLRRAASKVKADNPLFVGDTGFRVFKLDTSNIRPWSADAASLDAQMQASLSPLLEDRSQDDVMTELLLKRGIDLSVRLEVRDFDGLRVTCAGNGMLFTCLESHIPASSIEALASGLTTWHRELGGSADAVCYFIDEAFENNVAKSNLCATLVQQGLNQLHSL